MKEKRSSETFWTTLKEILFNFIFRYEHERQQQSSICLIFYILNAIVNLFIFLALPQISVLNIITYLNLPVFYALSGIIFLIVGQIILQLIKNISVHLLLQMEILVFIIQPLYILTISHLISQEDIASILGSAVIFISVIMTNLLLQKILYQRYRLYSLKCQGSTYIVASFNHFQTVLISLSFVIEPSLQLIRTTVILAVTIETHLLHFRKIQNDSMQYKCLNGINSSYICMSFILLLTDYYPSYLNVYLLSGIIVICYWLATIFVTKKNNQSKMTNIFLEQSGFQALADVADRLKTLSLAGYNNKKHTELFNFLVTIISEHNRKCTDPACQLASKAVEEQMTNKINRNTKYLTAMVIKKIDELMQIFHRKQIQNLDITFAYLRFLTYTLKNRSKLQKRISEASQYPLNLHQEYLIFSYQKILTTFDNKQSIDQVSIHQQFVQFEKSMYSALNLMQQFWVEFYEEKVDLVKIKQIAQKMFPFTAKIEELKNEAIKSIKYSSFKILTLYTFYLRLILHQEQEAIKMQDFLKVLLDRLKDNQQTKIQQNSETGLIVISLSDTKLGNIFMMNKLACRLFRYQKQNILGKNVSKLMPKVFGEKHDAILTDFLKKKKKKFNTDQRLLFGLDSSGYMFPMQLQLQKASFTSNDQFIFIATVKVQKVRHAPFYCLVDQHGYIHQHTSAFRNNFYQQGRYLKKKSIQQIIPDYFVQTEQQVRINHFQIQINTQKIGQVNAIFDVTPIIVKGQPLGQLISMTLEKRKTNQKLLFHNQPLTKVLKRKQIDDQLNSYTNTYNQNRKQYEVSKQIPALVAVKNSLNFTLPFLNYDDISAMVEQTQKVVTYGADIKILRYIDRHFERIDDVSSFHSQIYSEKGNQNIEAKIAQMKLNSGKGSEQVTSYTSFKILTIMLASIIIILVYTLFSIKNLTASQRSLLSNYSVFREARFYLPQFIVYASLFNNNFNSTFYQEKADQLAKIFVPDLQLAPLTQQQREAVMKVVISYADSTSTGNLQSDLSMPYLQDFQGMSLTLLWICEFLLCLIIVLALYVTFKTYKNTLQRVYTVFLSLKEPSIRSIHEACKVMMRHINSIQNRLTQGQDAILSVPKNNDDDNQIEKVKHFRMAGSFQQLIFFIKSSAPLLILMLTIILLLIIGNARIQYFKSLKIEHRNVFELMPATSSQLMKKVYQLTNNQSIIMDNQFEYYRQQYEIHLEHFEQYTTKYDFLYLLYSNICNNSDFIPINQSSSCQQIQNGVLTQGIASALNYLSLKISHLSISTAQDQVNLHSLVDLQFTYVIPVLHKLVIYVEDVIISKIQSEIATLQQVVILLLILFILYYFYLLLYPVRVMENEIAQTNGMITLVPKQQTQPEQTHILASQ